MSKSEKLLKTRNLSHGDWHTQSSLAQSLKDLMRGGAQWPYLTTSQKDALEMIAVKISRILTGDPNHKDHWNDIKGYAELGSQ